MSEQPHPSDPIVAISADQKCSLTVTVEEGTVRYTLHPLNDDGKAVLTANLPSVIGAVDRQIRQWQAVKAEGEERMADAGHAVSDNSRILLSGKTDSRTSDYERMINEAAARLETLNARKNALENPDFDRGICAHEHSAVGEPKVLERTLQQGIETAGRVAGSGFAITPPQILPRCEVVASKHASQVQLPGANKAASTTPTPPGRS